LRSAVTGFGGGTMNYPSGTVTFLFTDIEGSTKIAEQYRDQWEALRSRHHAILNQTMQAHNGHVFQIIGDAFCVAFHTAIDAVNAAVDAQKLLYQEAWNPAPIKVRVGIHSGTAHAGIVEDQSGGYVGYTALARTQRLMSAGHGGQVLISLATEELVGDELPNEVALRDMGARRLKDLIRPEHIFQLVIPNLPADFPPIKTLDAYRHNLPIQLTSFVGREKEMEQIAQSLSEHRLVTLTGVGGTGKTRLALQVAAEMTEQYTNGVWFVELAPISDPELVPQTILAALGLSEQPGRTILQILTDYFRERNLLLVLDNCEHLIQTSAKLADVLLNNLHSLKILATSREALGVKGEVTWHVPSLSLPDEKHLPSLEHLTQYETVRLFIERALLVQPTFTVTNDNAPFVAEICSRLDGIPLAIELAAARLRALSVEQIAKRLDDRFRLLTGGSRTSLERHQTLRATIDWSYNLLTEEEKKLFRSLSVFSGGWILEAAESVCSQESFIPVGGSEFDILDLLTQLVDKSLVNMDHSCYRMLETIRQYAREKLLDSNEGKAAHDNHLTYFLELAEQTDKKSHGPEQVEWMERLEMELDNFRVALDWCVSDQKTESALRLLCALSWTWGVRDHFSEVEDWFDKIRALPEVSNYPALYARMLNHMGDHRVLLVGDYQNAQSVLEVSRTIWLKSGADGEQGLAEALDCLGMVALYGKKDAKKAHPFLEQSFELYQKHADQWGMALVMHNLGYLALMKGQYAEAEEQMMISLTKFQELSDKFRVGYVLISLGEVVRLQGDYERAGKFYEQSLAIMREIHSRFSLGFSMVVLAFVSLHASDYRKAKALWEESLNLSNESGNKIIMVLCLMGFASVQVMIGKPEQAARLFGAVESLFESINYRMDPSDQKEFDHYSAAVRAQLDQAAFAKAWEDGRALTMEEAVSYALEETHE
jgi:predicted ATPase/class 3 adenylate cyclase